MATLHSGASGYTAVLRHRKRRTNLKDKLMEKIFVRSVYDTNSKMGMGSDPGPYTVNPETICAH